MKNQELAQRLRNVAYILEQSENSQNTYVVNEINSVVSELYFKELTKSDEIVTENYHEEDVDQKSIGLSTRHKANTPAVEPKEETWDDILAKYRDTLNSLRELEDSNENDFKLWLEENYLVPTRKI